MAKSSSFIEFEEKFVILEREYISLLLMARQEKISLTDLVGKDKLITIRDGLSSLTDELLDSLKQSEQDIARTSARLIINAIDYEIKNH